ncbi:hypothetical protein [Vibrio sp. 14G-20]|uniref:hypothetical protein n=1 Tax=Vibrio sp. 14G-20 TaxID=2994389 RepID=UPI00224B3FF8|nr:hypothetical protein [Vibrio sp. 14G-20]
MIEATQEEFEAWIKERDSSSGNTVTQSRIGDALISTAFLCLDHSSGGNTPEFFETVILSGKHR